MFTKVIFRNYVTTLLKHFVTSITTASCGEVSKYNAVRLSSLILALITVF